MLPAIAAAVTKFSRKRAATASFQEVVHDGRAVADEDGGHDEKVM